MLNVTGLNRRESNGLLHYFEKRPTTRNLKRPEADVERTVKEFSRPAAGKVASSPDDLRPSDVLIETTRYLLGLVSNSDLPWCDVYDFIFDRLRSVRQDFIIQRISGKDAILILEMNVTFLVYAGYRLCSESSDRFDSHINDTHLQECLKRLIVTYREMISFSSSLSSYHGQFVALYLIINLGNTEAIFVALQLKSIFGSDPVFKKTLALSLSWLKGNYVRMLRLVKGLPWLHLCAINRHLDNVRCHTLKVMSVAYAGKNLTYPLSCLSHFLLFDTNDDTLQFCRELGLTVDDGESVCFTRNKFLQTTIRKCKRLQWIDEQLKEVEEDDENLFQNLSNNF